MESVTDTR